MARSRKRKGTGTAKRRLAVERTQSVDYTIGVDPGLSGALVCINADGAIVEVMDMPAVYCGNISTGFVDGAAVRSFLNRIPPSRVHAFVEAVASRPGQGVSSTFKFGAAYGGVVSALLAFDLPVDLIVPSVWKRHHKLLKTEKDEARLLALKQCTPDEAHWFKRKKDGGRADAYLVARYGMETLGVH